MNSFTVYSLQFTVSLQFSVYNELSPRRQQLKTVNRKMKIEATEGSVS